MRVRFVSQPFADKGFDLRDFLLRILDDQSISSLDIAIAWAKRSGLRIVEDAIRAFRGRGGRVRMIIGISEGGATRQGLERAVRLADEAFIFHNPGRTFHPKAYAAYGDAMAEVLVGSHNLTAGGSARNYEAGILCELNLADLEDKRFLESIVDGYFEYLLDDSEVCIKLDADTLATISANPAYRVGDEDSPRASSIRSDSMPTQGTEDSDSVIDDDMAVHGSIFGRSKYALRSAPSITAAVRGSALGGSIWTGICLLSRLPRVRRYPPKACLQPR